MREGHSLRLSSDGRALLDDARSIVAIHDRAVARLESTELTGTVRLGTNEEVGSTRMAAVLGRFTRIHPSARVEFVIRDSEKLREEVDAGDIDVAVVQVSEANLRESDVLLWSDQLQWMTCCETPYHDGVVPLITFGENCFYRALSEPLLEENGIDHSVAFSGSSATGVHAAVSAGLGVAVLAERFLGDDLVEWSRGAALAPLPVVHQIARTRSDPDELACALHKAITDEFDSLQSAA